MTIDEAVKQLCEAPSCLSKSKAREILRAYEREVLENQEWYKKHWLNEFRKTVINECIEALPEVDAPKKKLGRPRKFANSGVKVEKIKLLSVEQIKEILNNLK